MSSHETPSFQPPHAAPDAPGALPLDRLDRAVLDVTTKMKELQATASEQARRLEAMEKHAEELERQHAITEAKLAVEMMHAAGLAAQASHMLTLAIDAAIPALPALLEEREVGGVPKSPLALLYDEAFDAKAAELGIDDPARFRQG